MTNCSSYLPRKMIEGLYNMYLKDKLASFDESINRRTLLTEVKDLAGHDFPKRIQDCIECLPSY